MTSVVIELFSRKIPIKTHDSQEHIGSLIEYIEGKMDEIDPDGRLPEMTLAILAMLNVADDLVKEKQRLKEMRDAVKSKSTFLLEKIEQSGYVC